MYLQSIYKVIATFFKLNHKKVCFSSRTAAYIPQYTIYTGILITAQEKMIRLPFFVSMGFTVSAATVKNLGSIRPLNVPQ